LAAAAGQQIGADAGDTAQSQLAVIGLGKRFAQAPPLDRAALANAVWRERRDEIAALVAQGTQLREMQSRLADTLAQVAWTTDLSKVRIDLAAHGTSWFRWFNRDYRQAQATLRGILKTKPPKPLEARLAIVDDLIAAQRLLWELDVQQSTVDLGKSAFGSLWRGAGSDWNALDTIDKWDRECAAKLPPNFREIFARIGDITQADAAVSALHRKLSELFEYVLDDARKLQLDWQVAFGVGDHRAV